MVEIARKIADLITPSIADLGFDLVRVQMTGGQNRPTIQIMAEPVDGSLMTLDACTLISRQISALMEVHDPLPDSPYVLEVSSPGIDRPLTRLKDYQAWAGFDCKLETTLPFQGRKNFKGKLGGLDADNNILLTDGKTDYHIAFTEIAKARLILTDDLIKHTEKQSQTGVA